MNKVMDKLGRQVKQTLDQGLDRLDGRVGKRLFEARQKALNRRDQMERAHGNFGGVLEAVFPHLRVILAVLALFVGAGGTYFWNQLDETYANEEIDSALLSDELPPEAYLDRGFHAWLERASQSQ